jgi:hypothetical protein
MKYITKYWMSDNLFTFLHSSGKGKQTKFNKTIQSSMCTKNRKSTILSTKFKIKQFKRLTHLITWFFFQIAASG